LSNVALTPSPCCLHAIALADTFSCDIGHAELMKELCIDELHFEELHSEEFQGYELLTAELFMEELLEKNIVPEFSAKAKPAESARVTSAVEPSNKRLFMGKEGKIQRLSDMCCPDARPRTAANKKRPENRINTEGTLHSFSPLGEDDPCAAF
jgi:hypothetical protein